MVSSRLRCRSIVGIHIHSDIVCSTPVRWLRALVFTLAWLAAINTVNGQSLPVNQHGKLLSDDSTAYRDSLRRGTSFLISSQQGTSSVPPGNVVNPGSIHFDADYYGTDSRPPFVEPFVYPTEQVGVDRMATPDTFFEETYAQPACKSCSTGHPALEPCGQPCEGFLHWSGRWLNLRKPYWLIGDTPLQGPNGRRYVGLGEPLLTESWRNRPYGASWFLGGLFATGLIDHRVDQGSGMFGGIRFGWDLDHYLGMETRIGFSTPGIEYPLEINLPADHSRIILWDLEFLYYPWGDTTWRPYILFGLGMASFDFADDTGRNINQTTLGLPFGIGAKYRWNSRLALRVEFLDNVAFGSSAGLENMNNVSLTAGIEYRFGGKRTSYWPWSPGRQLTF